MIIVWHLFVTYFLALKSKAWRNRNIVSSKQLWGPGPSYYSRTKWLRRTASEHWWNSTPNPSNLHTSSITWAKKSFPLFKPAWFGFSVTCSLLSRVEKGTFPYQFWGKHGVFGGNFAYLLRWRLRIQFKEHKELETGKQLPPEETSRNKNKGRNRGTSLVVQWLRLHAPKAGSLGSIPGQRTTSHIRQLRVQLLQLIRSCMPQQR